MMLACFHEGCLRGHWGDGPPNFCAHEMADETLSAIRTRLYFCGTVPPRKSPFFMANVPRDITDMILDALRAQKRMIGK